MATVKPSMEDIGFEKGLRIMQGEQEYIAYRDHSSLRIWPSETPFRYPRHSHSAVETIWTLSGEVVIETVSAAYHVTSGQILFIPSECPHSLSMDNGSSRLLFLFEPLMIMSMRDLAPLQSLWNQPIYLEEDSELRVRVSELLTRINEVYNSQEPFWNSLCYSDLTRIYALLGRAFSANEKSGPDTLSSPEIINTAIEYITTNYSRKITLDDVAGFVGFSRHYFSRIFKQYTGINFLAFLCRCRVNAAEQQLLNTDHSIQEIAFDCGFSSIATFNRRFLEIMDCTPGYYRKLHRQKT